MVLLQEFDQEAFPSGREREMREALTKPSSPLKNVVLISVFILSGLCGMVLTVARCLNDLLLKRPKSLKGKVCLVTGAGRGLGRELCLALAKEGAIVACADINSTNNEETARLSVAAGARAKAYTVNVAVKKEVEDAVALVEKELGTIYLVVNNAAIVMPMANPTEEYIRAIFNVNTLGNIWVCEAVLQNMKSRNDGHILNISSMATYAPAYPLVPYSSSKAAVTSYAQGLRNQLFLENPNSRIQITTVHPYLINTSQDYITTNEGRFNTVYEMEDVVKDTMNAIKYDKDDVSSPTFLRPLLVLKTLAIPCWFHAYTMRLFLKYIRCPNEKEIQLLPVGKIMKSSAFMEQKS